MTPQMCSIYLAKRVRIDRIELVLWSQVEPGGGQRGHGPFPKFLEYIVILCFERRFAKQNSIIRLKSNILPRPKIFGLATSLFVVSIERNNTTCNVQVKRQKSTNVDSSRSYLPLRCAFHHHLYFVNELHRETFQQYL